MGDVALLLLLIGLVRSALWLIDKVAPYLR
jgi:hypothetical protein